MATEAALRDRLRTCRLDALWLYVHGIETPADLEVEQFTTELEIDDLTRRGA
jgi:hypothetical protein